jgi:thioredoxin 1
MAAESEIRPTIIGLWTMTAFEFNDEDFSREVLLAAEPVLVDFWAPWCPPCRQIAPTVEELANENQGRAKIGKLNIDESPQVTLAYKVDGIPTLLLFKNGQVIDKFVGLQPKARLQNAIDAAIIA